jgi:hypothetical protein
MVSVLEDERRHALALANRLEFYSEIGDETSGAKNALNLLENGRFHRCPNSVGVYSITA